MWTEKADKEREREEKKKIKERQDRDPDVRIQSCMHIYMCIYMHRSCRVLPINRPYLFPLGWGPNFRGHLYLGKRVFFFARLGQK